MTLMSCSKYSEIETKANINSYCDNTYNVSVIVWVRDWYGMALNIEYWKWQHNVPESKVDSVTNYLMIGAIECKKNIDICLKKNK